MGYTKLISSGKLFHNLNKLNFFTRYSCGSSQTETSAENKKSLVVGVYEDEGGLQLSKTAEEIDQKSGGKISGHLNEYSTELKLGKAIKVTNVDPEYAAVAIAPLGKRDPVFNKLEDLDEKRENVRCGIGAGVSLLENQSSIQVSVDDADVADAAAEAAHLAAWKFEKFKTSVSRSQTALSLYKNEGSEEWRKGSILGKCQNWARYLSDMPANKMTPVDLAQEALDVLCPLGVHVTAHERTWIEAQGMEAFLAVARGSCEEPIFLQCEYSVTERPPVMLAAKGVTFDSGGLCLKTAAQMSENRGSMAGAAVVLAAIRALAELKVNINVTAVIPLCENMISGQCMKVGDVVKTLNGLSVEIEDTDLEGRLMLADALVYGQALYKPQLVIDVATFTHGMVLATGGGAFGAFTNSIEAWEALRVAGARTGDRPWLFPLWNYYQNQITDESSVDLRNKGSGTASPCIGAAFLRTVANEYMGHLVLMNIRDIRGVSFALPLLQKGKFICGDWMHLDVTGVGKLTHTAPPYLRPRRMSGRPTRTLASFLMDAAEQVDGPRKL